MNRRVILSFCLRGEKSAPAPPWHSMDSMDLCWNMTEFTPKDMPLSLAMLDMAKDNRNLICVLDNCTHGELFAPWTGLIRQHETGLLCNWLALKDLSLVLWLWTIS